MSQQPSEETSSNSPFTKFLGVLFVIVILAFVVVKLTTGPDDAKETADSSKSTQTETITTSEKSEDASTTADSEANIETAEVTEGSTSESVSENSQDIKEINQFLEDWKTAWQSSAGPNGNSAAYFNKYSDQFTSKNLSKNKWMKSKKIRNQGKSWIEVWISDIAISDNNDGSYRVTFKQEYSSSNYSDKGTKELVVSKSDGDWQIISENSM